MKTKLRKITGLFLALIMALSVVGGLNMTAFAQHFDCTNYILTDGQKKELNKTVKTVASDLNLKSNKLSSLEKTRRIYNFLCSSVKYDYTTLKDSYYYMHATAYAALINGTAVCNGYAEAFELLAKEAGLKSEIVESYNHAWNIVKIGSYYYNVDATWDSYNSTNYKYFLECNSDFENCSKSSSHKRTGKFNTASFNKNHPMASKSYYGGRDVKINTCAHKHKKALYKRKSTCKVGYHGGGKLCKDCGIVKGCTKNGSRVSCKKFWNIIIKPTCEEKGCKWQQCEYCRKTFREVSIPKKKHNFSKKATVNATCQSDGYTCTVCKNCGAEKKGSYKTLKKLGHKVEKVVKVLNPATCVCEGRRMVYCSRCKHSFTETMPRDSNAHSWDEGKVTVGPTETSDGKKVYTCSICKKTKTETIPATSVSVIEFTSSSWDNETGTRTLKWNQLSGYEAYQIYSATKPDFSDAKATIVNITSTGVKHKCSADKTYYYKVRAFNVVDGKRICTSFSKVRCCYVKDGKGYYKTLQ